MDIWLLVNEVRAQALRQATSGVENPATSLTRSAWRPGAGFVEQAADMRLDRGVGDAKGGCDLGNTADVDDGKQHAQLGRRQLIGPSDDVREQWGFQRRSANE